MTNLFSDIPSKLPSELTDVLASSQSVRIERIVSAGHSTAVGDWYDQDEHEWVVVLQGEAALEFEEDKSVIEMKPGDFINIPAHRKHRVHWTTSKEQTIWLAVFYS